MAVCLLMASTFFSDSKKVAVTERKSRLKAWKRKRPCRREQKCRRCLAGSAVCRIAEGASHCAIRVSQIPKFSKISANFFFNNSIDPYGREASPRQNPAPPLDSRPTKSIFPNGRRRLQRKRYFRIKGRTTPAQSTQRPNSRGDGRNAVPRARQMHIVSLIDEEDASSASCAISGSGTRGCVYSVTDLTPTTAFLAV